MNHRWCVDVNRLYDDRGVNTKTERICEVCGLIKVTMHPPGGALPWREWWKDGRKLAAMPGCVGVPGEVVQRPTEVPAL